MDGCSKERVFCSFWAPKSSKHTFFETGPQKVQVCVLSVLAPKKCKTHVLWSSRMDQNYLSWYEPFFLSWYEAQLFIAVIFVFVAVIEVLSWKVPPLVLDSGGSISGQKTSQRLQLYWFARIGQCSVLASCGRSYKKEPHTYLPEQGCSAKASSKPGKLKTNPGVPKTTWK